MSQQKRKKSKTFVHIGDILSQALAAGRRQAGGEMDRIWELWDKAVGPAVAENTRPAGFKGSLLVVHASGSAWIQQLQFLKKDLIHKINQALGKPLVTDMVFKIGKV